MNRSNWLSWLSKSKSLVPLLCLKSSDSTNKKVRIQEYQVSCWQFFILFFIYPIFEITKAEARTVYHIHNDCNNSIRFCQEKLFYFFLESFCNGTKWNLFFLSKLKYLQLFDKTGRGKISLLSLIVIIPVRQYTRCPSLAEWLIVLWVCPMDALKIQSFSI